MLIINLIFIGLTTDNDAKRIATIVNAKKDEMQQ